MLSYGEKNSFCKHHITNGKRFNKLLIGYVYRCKKQKLVNWYNFKNHCKF